MITIVSIFNSGGNLFFRPKDKGLYADAAKERFNKGNDIESYLQVFKEWEENDYSVEFCRINYV